MTRLALIFLTGCSAHFTDPCYFDRGRPGPHEQAIRAAERKALDADQTQRVRLEAQQAISKAHREHARTNDLTPPLPQTIARHPRNEKANRP